jgi:tape measure domain-containing protein
MSVDITTIGYEVDTRQVKSASKDLDKLGQASDAVSRKADGANAAFAGWAKGAGALGVALGAMGLGKVLINQIDQYTKYTAQIKLATRSTEEYKNALTDVSRIAKTAQADIAAVGNLYARLSNSLRDLGVSQNGIANVTEVVGLALKVSGANAAEAASTMLQLSQAFNSGRLAGQEFTALAENAPPLMRALAESMGVPIGALKQLAADGKITADVLNKAYGDPKLLERLREQAKEVQTIGGAFQVLKNNALEAIGQLDKATGFSKGFSAAITAIANAITTLADIAQNKRIDLDRVFPGYANFLKYQQSQGGLPQRELNQPGKGGTQFLAPGARMDQVGRIDYGTVGQVNAGYVQLQGTLAKLREDNPLKDLVSAQQKYAEGIANINKLEENGLLSVQEATRYRAQFTEELAKATNKTNELTESQKQMLKELQNTIDIEGELAVDAYNKQQKVMLDWYERTNEQIVKDIKKRYDAEQDYIERTNKQIQKGLIERGRDMQREADRINEALTRSITDGIFRGFENGKGFFENFKDVLINGIKTALFQPLISNIIKGSGIGSLFSSVTAFAGGEGGAAAGGFSFSNLLGGLKTSFDAFSGNLVGGIEKLGAMIANGNGGIADAIGGFMGQYSGAITTALSFAPAVFSLLKGDLKGAAFSGGGAGIGFALGGPAGAAIGGALGSVLGGAFGRKKNPRYTTAMTSIYGKNGLVSSGQVNAAGKDTDMFAGSLTQLNNQFAKALGSVYEMFDKDIKRLQIDSVFSYKKGKQTIGHTTGTIDGKFFGFGAQGFGKDISAGFAEFAKKMMGEGLAHALRTSSLPIEVRRSFRSVVSASVIAAIVTSFGNLNNTLTVFEDKLEVTNLQLLAAANRTGLVGTKLADVINGISADLGNFYNLYYTDAEKITDANKALTKQFTALGLTLPSTKDAFRALVEGVDTTTIAGQDMFTSLLKLGPAFAQYMDAMNQQDQALQNQTESLKALAQQLDKNLFRTLVDYTRAQRYIENGIPMSQLPSYDVGTPFVPQTGPAMIHQGERILTAAENRQFSANSAQMTTQLINEIRALRADIRSGDTAIAIATQKSAKILDKFDREGILLAELDNDGNAVVVPVEIVA